MSMESIDQQKFNELKRVVATYGTVVQSKRLSLGLTQEKLSKLSGVSVNNISLIESHVNSNMADLLKVVLALTGHELLLNNSDIPF